MLNSEKFKSAEERRVAYENYCEECGKKHMALMDEFGWLDLEYEEEVKSCPSKKQAKIIFYTTDQTTACFIEDENGHATINNPYKHITDEKKKKGDYYGLSVDEYKKLLEKDGYEWVVISNNGFYGSKVWDKSYGYVFKGKYEELKVGDIYHDGYDMIEIQK